jgi:hypothetical protein
MTSLYFYERVWRRTEMGGITEDIAICLVCRRIIKPSNVVTSRRGTHGTKYYVHEHPLLFVTLERSNSGKRYIIVPKELETIKDVLERAWVYEGATIGEITKLISLYLSLQSSSSSN